MCEPSGTLLLLSYPPPSADEAFKKLLSIWHELGGAKIAVIITKDNSVGSHEFVNLLESSESGFYLAAHAGTITTSEAQARARACALRARSSV